MLDLQAVIERGGRRLVRRATTQTRQTADGDDGRSLPPSCAAWCAVRWKWRAIAVVEAADTAERYAGTGAAQGRMVLAATGPAVGGGRGLLEEMRRAPDWRASRRWPLADTAEQAKPPRGATAGFRITRRKFDREAMLRSLARLAERGRRPGRRCSPERKE